MRIERNGSVVERKCLFTSSTRRSVFSGVFHARSVTTTLSTKPPTDRARRLANFWKQIEENDKVRSVYGGISWVSLFTFFSTEFRADRWVNGGSNGNKSRKTTSPDRSTIRIYAPVGGVFSWGSLKQIEENDKVRSVYGGSVCFFSTEFRADRWVNGGTVFHARSVNRGKRRNEPTFGESRQIEPSSTRFRGVTTLSTKPTDRARRLGIWGISCLHSFQQNSVPTAG